MSVIEVDKQIHQFLNNQDKDLSDAEDEDWNPPIPQYEFPERARIVEAFYGPEAEILDDDLALARRIQVTKDLTALYGLSEPTRRGKSGIRMTMATMKPSKNRIHVAPRSSNVRMMYRLLA
jgi:hypothetical protein